MFTLWHCHSTSPLSASFYISANGKMPAGAIMLRKKVFPIKMNSFSTKCQPIHIQLHKHHTKTCCILSDNNLWFYTHKHTRRKIHSPSNWCFAIYMLCAKYTRKYICVCRYVYLIICNICKFFGVITKLPNRKGFWLMDVDAKWSWKLKLTFILLLYLLYEL